MEIGKIILAIFFSFLFTYLFMPSLIKIADKRKLFVPKTYRRSHNKDISSLGGIAIFSGTLFSFFIFIDYVKFDDFKFLISGVILLFLIGLRDDLHQLKSYLKLIGQTIVALIVVVLGDIRITSFYGLLGIYNINYTISIIITIILIIGIINSFNMIDGINMLAAVLSLIFLLCFGLWFYLSGQFDLSLMLFALSGSILAFLQYNGISPKIFMGDIGTNVIGLVMSVAIIIFIELNSISKLTYHINAAPAVAFGMFCLPLTDMIRIVIIRIFRGKSPFTADKNHLHHILLRKGFSHKKTTFLYALFSFILISINFLLQYIEIQINLLMLVNFIIPGIFIYLVIKRKNQKNA